MVVLNVKNIKGLVLILLLTAGILASCSKDRLIDVEPYIYPTEYWKKDSLVYTLLLDTTVLNQQVTPYGISSPDTLSLFYETQEYTLTFLEESKNSVFGYHGILERVTTFHQFCIFRSFRTDFLCSKILLEYNPHHLH